MEARISSEHDGIDGGNVKGRLNKDVEWMRPDSATRGVEDMDWEL